MHFFQARKDQPPVRAFAPVVEVAGDDERRASRNFVGDQIRKTDQPVAGGATSHLG